MGGAGGGGRASRWVRGCGIRTMWEWAGRICSVRGLYRPGLLSSCCGYPVHLAWRIPGCCWSFTRDFCPGCSDCLLSWCCSVVYFVWLAGALDFGSSFRCSGSKFFVVSLSLCFVPTSAGVPVVKFASGVWFHLFLSMAVSAVSIIVFGSSATF